MRIGRKRQRFERPLTAWFNAAGGKLNHGVGAVALTLAIEGVDEVGERFHGLPWHAFKGPRADVRGDDDLGVVEQWVVCGWGLFVQHIGGVTSEFPGIQRGDDGGLVDEFATAGVDEP